MKNRKILDTKAGGNFKKKIIIIIISWMEDKDLVLSVKDQAKKKTGESKYSGQYMLISNINTRFRYINSYTLAQFVGKYLHTHRPELAHDEIETQRKLEKRHFI